MIEKITKYIDDYNEKNGYPPTFSEIAIHCGCTKQNIAINYVPKLEEKLRRFSYYRRLLDLRKSVDTDN